MQMHACGQHGAFGGVGERMGAHFLDQTALKPKVRLETMAEMKPVQLKVRSDADARATPNCARQLSSDHLTQAARQQAQPNMNLMHSAFADSNKPQVWRPNVVMVVQPPEHAQSLVLRWLFKPQV